MDFDLNKIDKKLLLGGVIGIIVLLILILFFVSIIFSGNSNETENNSKTTFNNSNEIFKSDFRKEVEELNKEFKEKIYSFDLIEKDFEEGKISKDEYFIQSTYAAFESEKIDAKYAGEELSVAPDAFLWMLVNEFNSLSKDSQEKLEKYILTPSNPKSFWYSNEIELKKEKNDLISFSSIMQNKHPVTGLEYQVEIPAGMNTQKTIVENAFSKAYSKFSFGVGLNEPKDWVHVFVMDLPKYDGLAYMAESDGKERCILLINKGLNEKMMKTTVAHELFHCFQFHVPLKYSGDEMWLMEATAVLSEELVYANENTEHNYDSEFFGKLNKHMFNKEGLREYGSYLWFFYLYQNEGKTPDFLREILLNASSKGTKKAIQEIEGFDYKFKEYALWNYNSKPDFKFYLDAEGKPTAIPYGNSVNTYEFILEETEYPYSINVEKGGMKYFDFGVMDSVKRIEFDFTGLNGNQKKETGIQMIYELNGEKQYLDVSELDKIEFCRTRMNEKVESVLFIVSNSELDSKLEGNIKIDSKGECAPVWSGYVKINWNYSKNYELTNLLGNSATEIRTRTGNYFSKETLIYDKEENEFLLDSRTASLKESDVSTIKYGNECGNQSKYDADFINGNYSESNDTLFKPMYELRRDLSTRIRFNEKTKKYELNIGAHMGENVHYSSIISYTRIPCPLEGIFTPAPYYAPQKTSYLGQGREPMPNNVPEVILSSDGKHLFGEGTANFQSGGEVIPVQIIIDFRYG
jgi:hypothetical protein